MMEGAILGIDPGQWESAYVILDGLKIQDFGHISNAAMLEMVGEFPDHVAVEAVKSYGMAVGDAVIETCYMIGAIRDRAQQRGLGSVELIPRKTIATELCGSARANDSNIRAALIDVYGDKGTRSKPGGTYGIAKHVWSALAVATVAREIMHQKSCNPRIVLYDEE